MVGVSCTQGTLIDANSIVFGVISSDTTSKKYCHQDALDINNKNFNHKSCSSLINKKKLKDRLVKECDGKNNCQISTRQIMNSKIEEDDVCGDDAYLFVQAPCKFHENERIQRQVSGLLIACIGVMIYLFCLIFFDYIKCIQETLYVDWDVKTITAGDYTVEFNINIEIYQMFLAKFYDPANPISENN